MLEVEVLQAKAEKKRARLIVVLIAILAIGILAFLSFSGGVVTPSEKAQIQNISKAVETKKAAVEKIEDKEPFNSLYLELKETIIPTLSFYSDEKTQLLLSNAIPNELSALAQFSAQGAFSSALNKAKALKQQLNAHLQDIKLRVDEIVSDIETAWREKNLKRLSDKLQELRATEPKNKAGDEFQGYLDDWDLVAELKQKIEVAKSEQNIQEEIRLLKKLQSLKQDEHGINERITELGILLEKNSQALLVKKLNDMLEGSNLEAIEKLVMKVSSFKTDKDRYQAVLNKAKNVIDRLRYERAIKSHDDLIARDSWESALQALSDVPKSHQTKADYVKKLQFSSKIVSAARKGEGYLRAPLKLVYQRNKQALRDLINEIRTMQPQSQKISILNEKLVSLLSDYETKVQVTVLSDGISHVTVKSVGVVGVHKRKTIQLVPGNYVFEGKRDGYVTKRIEVTLKPKSHEIINVVPDEQI